MVTIYEIAMVILGCFMIARKKLYVGSVHVEGQDVRWAGICLVAPFVIGLVLGFFVGVQRSRLDIFTYSRMLSTVQTIETIGMVVGTIAAAYLIFRANGSIEKTKSQPLSTLENVPAVMTLYEAGDYLRISEHELVNFIEAGQITAVKVSDGYRIARQALDDFVQRK